ncbi:hypothetical protein ES703_49288 [subsurface metagenome]
MPRVENRLSTYVKNQLRKVAKPVTARIVPAAPAIARRKTVDTGRTLCEKRSQRKAVLLAIGKVSRSGGAPGPYRRRESSKEKCK